MKGHIQIIGTVEIVFGILGLMVGIFVGIAAIFVPLFIMEGDDSGASNQVYVAIFVGILLLAVTLLILAFAIASIVSGRRLMQYKNSGRIGTMIIGAISLINFPLGTIFGVVALYVLTRPEVEPLFS